MSVRDWLVVTSICWASARGTAARAAAVASNALASFAACSPRRLVTASCWACVALVAAT